MDTEILAKIPKAQEAYMTAWNVVKGADNTELLETIALRMREIPEQGRFVAGIGGIEPLVAEKTAIQLERLGYSTSVTADQPVRMPDGKVEYRCVLNMSWLHMPANKRDDFSL